MSFRNLFNPSIPPHQALNADDAETETMRKIVRALQEVDPDRRRYLAGFAYLLARAAHADLDISDDETREMEQIVAQVGGLPMAQAVLVAEIARNQSELYSGTEDYVVTREFRNIATAEERRAAVAACFVIAASDGEITAEEYAELTQIAEELDLSRPELNEIRAQYRDQLSAIKHMRQQRTSG